MFQTKQKIVRYEVSQAQCSKICTRIAHSKLQAGQKTGGKQKCLFFPLVP
jgi:hypothetical protein